MEYLNNKVLMALLALLPVVSSFGESLMRSYGEESPPAQIKGVETILTTTTEINAFTVPQAPLDLEHRDAIVDVLVGETVIPGPLNYTINCFIASQGNTPLFVVAKYVKEECGIVEIELLFDYFDVLDIPSARKLVVPLLNGLVKEINQNQKVAKYFAVYPIDPSQIVIRVRVRPPNCGLSYPAIGNIASIMVANGVVSYGTLNSYTREIDYLRIEPLTVAEKLL